MESSAAYGAGKSTFQKSSPGSGALHRREVSILPNTRMSVLKQNQNAYDAYSAMDTVIMGNQRLYDIGKEKEALYAKGGDNRRGRDAGLPGLVRRSMPSWAAGSLSPTPARILQGSSIGTDLHYNDMATLDARLKVKVLLAQALFGSPDLLMDEPTNNLDIDAGELAGGLPAGLPRHRHRGQP